jgi:succinyl-CoA synthetase beta subunit
MQERTVPMKLYEYQSKTLFDSFGIPTVQGENVQDPEAAVAAARRIGGTAVVKAQLLVGGRGKAGGVKLVNSPGEAGEAAREILSMRIKSLPVRSVLVVEAVGIEKEYYVSFTLDRSRKEIVFIASGEGGVEIEELAATNPDRIHLLEIDPLAGIDEKELDRFLENIFIGDRARRQAHDVVNGMYRLLQEKDCSLVEINPLALTQGGKLVALDAKIILDDNALYKHPDLAGFRNSEEYSPDEIEAKQYGLSFVGLDGTIGCIVNGAGLAMATMDLIKLFGAAPANFLDVGGSSSPEKVIHAFDILTRNERIKAVLVNIFGGITRCDDIAEGIIHAREKMNLSLPLVIRLIGTNEQEGQRMLREAGIAAHENLVSAVKEVVKYA